MAAVESIFRGNNAGPWPTSHDVDGSPRTLTVDDSCTVKVSGTNILRAVTDRSADNLYFMASLTAAETATMTVGETYIVIVQIQNAALTPALVKEDHRIIQIVAGFNDTPAPQTEVERLTEDLAILYEGRRAFIQGGAVIEAWNGRYGNKVKYQVMSLADFDKAIKETRVEINKASRLDDGLSARGHTRIVWSH